MVSLVEAVMVGFLVLLVFVIWLIARKAALRFFVQVGVGLAAALLAHRAGWSDALAFMGVGMTLSLIYYMGK